MENRSSTMRSTLSLALDHAMNHLSPREGRSVAATSTLAELRQRTDLPLNQLSIDADKVVNELVSAVEGGIIDSAGGRFFGWVIGGSLPAALAADWLTSARGPNARPFRRSPPPAVREETTR